MKKITAGDSVSRSPDLISENLEQMKALFPEAFTEGRVDFEVLKELLGGTVDEGEEKYGLNWHGKRQARQLALTPSTGTLRPCPEDSVDWDTTQNLMIEGDNLEVLKLLQKSYAGKVKLIYIDPPYNTGKDFIYPDNYRDSIRNYLELTAQVDGENRKRSSNTEASGRFHTDWLNMMYPRLMLARNLLSADGVIAVSIDEHEFFNLRCILDSVFGEENFIVELSVSLNPKGRQITRFFATSHEYVVIYAKRVDECVLQASSKQAVDEDDFPHLDQVGRFRLLPLRNTNKKFHPRNRPNLYYPLYVNEQTGNVSCRPGEHPREVLPVFGDGLPAVWRWSKPKVQNESTALVARMVRGRKGNRWDVFQKDYLSEGRTKKLKTVWQSSEVGSTDSAVSELKDLIGLAFDSPKPTRLIQQIIRMMPSDSIVLDFFAGSGTTGHAVMSECAVDEAIRRYVLVQIPQSVESSNDEQRIATKICERLNKPCNIAELTKERLRRAAIEIKKRSPMFAGDLGFRVFKLNTSNVHAWEPDRDELEASLLNSIEHIREGRSEDDILYELLLKLGLDLCIPIETRVIAGKTVRSVGAGTLITCLAESIASEEVEPLGLGIADYHGALEPAGDTTVVFRDSAFADDVAKTNLTAILEQRGLGNVRSL